MNIYLVYRTDENRNQYDEYDSFVAIAADAEAAKQLHPAKITREQWVNDDWYRGWPSISQIEGCVEVTYLGQAPNQEPRIILASFNAG